METSTLHFPEKKKLNKVQIFKILDGEMWTMWSIKPTEGNEGKKK